MDKPATDLPKTHHAAEGSPLLVSCLILKIELQLFCFSRPRSLLLLSLRKALWLQRRSLLFFKPFFSSQWLFPRQRQSEEFPTCPSRSFKNSPQISTYISSWSDRWTFCIFKLLWILWKGATEKPQKTLIFKSLQMEALTNQKWKHRGLRLSCTLCTPRDYRGEKKKNEWSGAWGILHNVWEIMHRRQIETRALTSTPDWAKLRLHFRKIFHTVFTVSCTWTKGLSSHFCRLKCKAIFLLSRERRVLQYL